MKSIKSTKTRCVVIRCLAGRSVAVAARGWAVAVNRRVTDIARARNSFERIKNVSAVIKAHFANCCISSAKGQLFGIKRMVKGPGSFELFKPLASYDANTGADRELLLVKSHESSLDLPA
jgi:hypothetical protein